MKRKLTAQVHFTYRASIGMIYAELSFAGERVRVSTGERVPPDKWDSTKKYIKRGTIGYLQITAVLESVKERLLQAFREVKANDSTNLSRETVLNRYYGLLDTAQGKVSREKIGLIELFDRYTETKARLRPSTKASYRGTRYWLTQYEQAKRKTIYAEDVNAEFRKDIEAFLRKQTMYGSSTMRASSVELRLLHIKAVLRFGFEHDLHENKAYQKAWFKLTNDHKTKKEVILTADDIGRIEQVDLSSHDWLEATRWWFLLQCYSGQRYSDLQRLLLIEQVNGSIRIEQTKTRETAIIPLHPKLKQALIRCRELSLPSNMQMNRDLKVIGKLAGLVRPYNIVRFSNNERYDESKPLFELLTTHVGRSSFITIAIEKGVSLSEVMRVSGHKNLATLQRYVRHTPQAVTEKITMAFSDLELSSTEIPNS